MMKHFDIDGLISYMKETVSETKSLVNPAYRALENEQRKRNGKLTTKKARFATLTIKEDEIEEKKMTTHLAKKAQLLEEIEQLENQIGVVKTKKTLTERKITFSQLPEDQKFSKCHQQKKTLHGHDKNYRLSF